MKLIPLTQGKSAQVDDWWYNYLIKWKWNTHSDNNRFVYAKRTEYIKGSGKKHPKYKTIIMHRVIMNTPEGMQVDHINHNTLDCQEKNMRNCTQNENCRNRIGFGTSKYLGVHMVIPFYKGKIYAPKFYARIVFNGKRKHLGSFNDEIEAAKAFDRFAIEHDMKFINLNFKHHENL